MLGECKSFDDVESDKQLWMRHCGRTLRSSSLLELTTHEVSQFLQQSGVVRSFASKNVAIYIYIYIQSWGARNLADVIMDKYVVCVHRNPTETAALITTNNKWRASLGAECTSLTRCQVSLGLVHVTS